MTLDDLTVNFGHLDRRGLLSDWQWLIGQNKLPILIAASGDAFLQDESDGAIHVLDVAAGTLSKVAESFEAFRSLLSDAEFVRNHFAAEMVGDLKSKGVQLQDGQIYTFKKPPVLGGEFVLENVEPSDISVHFSLTGQIHEKVRKLPEGTSIDKFSID